MSSEHIHSASMGHPRRVAIYCRLSYALDGSLEQVERQEADCRALADRLGWTVAQVYPDNSRSAWQRNRKRPNWDRMLADIEAGKLDAIIVYHGDRLIRQPWDLELLLKLADERHLQLASVSGTRNLSNEDDRFILRIEAAQACKSSADTSRRVRRGWEARAKRGNAVGGGKRPFGFGVPTGGTTGRGNPHYDTTQQVPEESAVLREAVTRLISGQTLGSVCRWMNSVSTTTQGNQWTARGIKHLVFSPRIAGLVEHHGQLYEANWTPIISKDEWEDVKSVLQHSSNKHGYFGRERSYLLSGIATCYACGAGLRTKPAGGRNRKSVRIYCCLNPTCAKGVARNVDHLDRYVEGRVLRRLNEGGFLDMLHADTEDDSGIGTEIASLERRRSQAQETLENLAEHPEVSAEMATKALASFDRKIAELRNSFAATTHTKLLRKMAGISRDLWDAEPIDVRAETVRALFNVVVLPATRRGPGFDPRSVRMTRLNPQ